MSLEQAYFITQIIVGIGFIISIVFLAVQLRQNSFLLRNSMADQRRQRIGWIHEHFAPITTSAFSTVGSTLTGKISTKTKNIGCLPSG